MKPLIEKTVSPARPSRLGRACVQSLGWEDPLEEGLTTHSSILAGKILWTEEPAGYSSWGRKESDMISD